MEVWRKRPVDLGQRVDPGGEVSGNSQHVESAGEAQFAICESGAKPLQEQIAEAAGERTDGEEEVGWTGNPARLVGRDAASGHDAV